MAPAPLTAFSLSSGTVPENSRSTAATVPAGSAGSKFTCRIVGSESGASVHAWFGQVVLPTSTCGLPAFKYVALLKTRSTSSFVSTATGTRSCSWPLKLCVAGSIVATTR